MLIEVAGDQSDAARGVAVRTLGLIGSKVDGVVTAIRAAMADPDLDVRKEASAALARLGEPEASALAKALTNPNSRVRETAAHALRLMGPSAAPAASALVTLLNEEDDVVLTDVTVALKAIGAPAVPALVKALDHPAPSVRLRAIEVFAAIRPLTGPAAKRLESLREDEPDPEVRRFAILALAIANPGSEESITVLANALRSEQENSDPRYRAMTAVGLDALGRSDSRESISALLKVLPQMEKGEDNEWFVASALQCAGPASIPFLIEGMREGRTSEVLGGVFQQIGPIAVPALIEAFLSERDASKRAMLLNAVWKIVDYPGNHDHEDVWRAVPALRKATEDQDERVRHKAQEILHAIRDRN